MPAKVLAVRLIPRVDAGLRERLKLDARIHSLGLITCDSDDVGYTALDEATKKADVRVCYAQSMYAGAANANTALAGEFLGILAGPAPDEVESGLAAAIHMIEHEASFYSANADDSVVYYAHCISRTGSYLSAQCGIPEGSPLAYLIGAGAHRRVLRPAFAHQFRRRTADRLAVRLPRRLRGLCPGGDRRGLAPVRAGKRVTAIYD